RGARSAPAGTATAGDPPGPFVITDADAVVVGAGIVGLATARALLDRGVVRRVAVVDKEDRDAAHPSQHNSGMIHSGIYYRPGSAKARLVAKGRRQLERYCAEHGVPVDRCGKVVVATTIDEVAALHRLHRRADELDIEVQLLDRRGLAERE